MTGSGSRISSSLGLCLLVLLVLGGGIPPNRSGAHALPALTLRIDCDQGEAYALVPGQRYRIVVSCDDPGTSAVEVSLTGPGKETLVSYYGMVWNQTGFHDLGRLPDERCLVGGESATTLDTWMFYIVLPNATAAGVWEARASANGLSAAAGFRVATVHWDSRLLAQTPFTDVMPGGVSVSTVRIAVSCNGEVATNITLPELSGPGGSLPPDTMLLDDDPSQAEQQETGNPPIQMGNGSIAGPTITAGIGRELELYLFLKAPTPLGRGVVSGRVWVGFEPTDGLTWTLVDAYVSILRGLVLACQPPAPVPIEYAADLDTASHKSGLVFPLDIKQKQLAVLEEAGVSTIRITPAYDIFLRQDQARIADLDALVSRIRSDGRKLMIADGAAEEYWTKPMNWPEFSQAFVDRVRTLAARYKPEYYVVVKEPIWYMGMNWSKAGGMLTEAVAVDQWLSLTATLCDAVKQASPFTKTGIAIALPYQESQIYLLGASQLANVDFVGVDLYNLGHLGVADSCMSLVTKPKWILETWDGNPDTQQGQMWRRTTSAEWIRMVVHCAQSRGYAGVATFHSLYLCYDYAAKPASLDAVRAALDNRQEAFWALQSLIEAG